MDEGLPELGTEKDEGGGLAGETRGRGDWGYDGGSSTLMRNGLESYEGGQFIAWIVYWKSKYRHAKPSDHFRSQTAGYLFIPSTLLHRPRITPVFFRQNREV